MRKTLDIVRENQVAVSLWLPPLASAGVAGVAFVTIGATPYIRALSLAGTILVMALMLRRFGGIVAFGGGLALAFSPAFWSQAGGGQPLMVTLILALVIAASLVAIGVIWVAKRPGVGLAAGLILFAVLFWELVGTSRSLRLTTFLNVTLIYLLIDALFTANPRPDESDPLPLKLYHTWGLLITLTLGVLNDSLLILNAPAVILGLIISRTRLPRWYWIIVAAVIVIGLRGISIQYLSSTWWTYPAAQAEAFGIQVPFIIADGWREGTRWLALFSMINRQFTIVGLVLGIVGLSRLARWYPPLGIVTLSVYTSYAIFGLVYFGGDSQVLLLPLLMIQIIWMSYAVNTFGQWLQKISPSFNGVARWLAPAAFMLLPFVMLMRVMGIL